MQRPVVSSMPGRTVSPVSAPALNRPRSASFDNHAMPSVTPPRFLSPQGNVRIGGAGSMPISPRQFQKSPAAQRRVSSTPTLGRGYLQRTPSGGSTSGAAADGPSQRPPSRTIPVSPRLQPPIPANANAGLARPASQPVGPSEFRAAPRHSLPKPASQQKASPTPSPALVKPPSPVRVGQANSPPRTVAPQYTSASQPLPRVTFTPAPTSPLPPAPVSAGIQAPVLNSNLSATAPRPMKPKMKASPVGFNAGTPFPVQQPSQSPKRLGSAHKTSPVKGASWHTQHVDTDTLQHIAEDVIALLDDKWEKTDVSDSKNLGFEWELGELDRLLQWLEPLCYGCKEILKAQDYPMVNVKSPVCVLGDIHGRFDDLHFFINEIYDSGVNELLARSKSRKDFRIANNFLLLGCDGEHEVAGIRDVPDALSSSCADLSQFRKQASMWAYGGRKSMRTNNLLFLGDFVDRGFGSLEVVMYVLALKALAPENVHLLRGNHETEDINDTYGFKAQCEHLFGVEKGRQAWWMVNRVFDDFPLAATLDGKIFCAHGGIPRLGPGGIDDRLAILQQTEWWKAIRDAPCQADALQEPKFKRFAEIFEDLLWADPAEDVFEEDLDLDGFGESLRGISVMYGTKAVDTFLEKNNISLIMRAHQMKSCGFSVSKSGKVITVFSSSHYDLSEDNFAGVAYVTPGTVRAITRMEA